MGMQLKFITKEEAHKLIDEMPGTRIMMLTYNSNIGISEDGRYIKKKCGKKYTDKAKEEKYLNIVSSEVKRLSRLVKSMLDLSRIDSGEMKIHMTSSALTTNREWNTKIVSTILRLPSPPPFFRLTYRGASLSIMISVW